MRTFIAVVLLATSGLRVAGEQPGATDNACVGAGTGSRRLLPVDQAPSNAGFLAYRAGLRTAVERRDIDALVEAADPGIRLGFDASGGRDTLRKEFSARPELWDELRVVLANGGRFSTPASFAAPYVYASWPDQFDSFGCAAVTGRNVRLRAAPGFDAAIVASVSYAIVRVVDRKDGAPWWRVRLGNGRTGYMWHAYVRSPVDYRALFNLIDGRWRMTAFVAGD